MATLRALLAAFPADAPAADAELALVVAGARVFDGLLDESRRVHRRGAASGRHGSGRAPVVLRAAARRGEPGCVRARRDLRAAARPERRRRGGVRGAAGRRPRSGLVQRVVALVNLASPSCGGCGSATPGVTSSRRSSSRAAAGAHTSRSCASPRLAVGARLAACHRSPSSSPSRRWRWPRPTGGQEIRWLVRRLAVARGNLLWLGRFEEAERWLERAGRAPARGRRRGHGPDHPAAAGLLALARGRPDEALAAFGRPSGCRRAPVEHPPARRVCAAGSCRRRCGWARPPRRAAALRPWPTDATGRDADRRRGGPPGRGRPRGGGRRARAGHRAPVRALHRRGRRSTPAARCRGARAARRPARRARRRSSARSTSPNPKASSCRSRRSRSASCSSATPATAPRTRRSCPRSSTCSPGRPRRADGGGAPLRRRAQRRRTARRPVPAEQPQGAGDRRRALRLGEHGADAHPPHLRQARRAQPHRGGRPRPRARPARPLDAAAATRLRLRRLSTSADHPFCVMTAHPLPRDALRHRRRWLRGRGPVRQNVRCWRVRSGPSPTTCAKRSATSVLCWMRCASPANADDAVGAGSPLQRGPRGVGGGQGGGERPCGCRRTEALSERTRHELGGVRDRSQSSRSQSSDRDSSRARQRRDRLRADGVGAPGRVLHTRLRSLPLAAQMLGAAIVSDWST